MPLKRRSRKQKLAERGVRPEAQGLYTLPEQVASIKDVERIYGLDVKFLRIIRETGKYPECFDRSGRVSVLPLFVAINDILRKLGTQALVKASGLSGFADLDKDAMQARVNAQVEIEKMRDNALANKQLLTREGVEKALSEPLMAVATRWKNYEKDTGSKIKSLLLGAGVPLPVITQALNLACSGVEAPMVELRKMLNPDEKDS